MLPKIFINYRRKDSRAEAKIIYEKLSSTFGSKSVFLDTESISPGEIWPDYLSNKLNQAAILIVIIGENWLTISDSYGKRLIDNKEDWVRKEIEIALKQNKRIFPVCINEVKTPPQEALPEDIQECLCHQGVNIRLDYLDKDIELLIDAINKPVLKKSSILLTSTSPGRVELLEQVGWKLDRDYFATAVAVTLDDKRCTSKKLSLEEAKKIAIDTAKEKIHNAIFVMHDISNRRLNHSDTIVIGADTIVYCSGRILDRPLLRTIYSTPTDIAQAQKRAYEMLSRQKGKKIHVITGLAIALADDYKKNVECTSVETEAYLKDYSDSDICKYIDTDEPLDKAGAFGIQGIGVSLFNKINGSYSNIVGLPLREFITLLQKENFSNKFDIPKFNSEINNSLNLDSSSDLSVVCIGDINYDFIYDDLPKGYFSKLKPPGDKINQPIYRGAGGTAVQFARGARGMGFNSCLVIGVVGLDALGQEIEHNLQKEGISTLLPPDQAQPTSIAIIIRDASKSDTSLTFTDAHQLLPNEVVDRAKGDIKKSDVFYCSGYCILDERRKLNARKLLFYANKHNPIVVFDVVAKMSMSISYHEFKNILKYEKDESIWVDVLVSELNDILLWMDLFDKEKDEIQSFKEHQDLIVDTLRADFPTTILRTSNYRQEIIITPNQLYGPVKTDYCSLPARKKIGYGDKRTAEQIYNFLTPRIVLASKSPQRYYLLSQIVSPSKIEVCDSNFPEDSVQLTEPKDRVQLLSKEKALAVFHKSEYSNNIEYIIGADTEIYYIDDIGKKHMIGHPNTAEEAKEDLTYLSGKSHVAITGITIIGNDPNLKNSLKIFTHYEETKVTLDMLTESEILEYVSSNEPLHRAGSYAIQGLGTKLIKSIDGSYSNVVGLPLEKFTDIFANIFQNPIWNFDKVSNWRLADPIKGKNYDKNMF